MKTSTWLTPPEILARLGKFDLDPCCPTERPWEIATRHFTLTDDGLTKHWNGRVWLNPPFGREVDKWMAKMAQHGNGIALLAARTETEMFFRCVWSVATSILFLKGRPHFHFADGKKAPFNSGAPICLIAYGKFNDAYLKESKLGKWIRIRKF